MSRSICIHKFNPEDPASSGVLQEVSVPTVGDGQVLVRMTHRPVNPADIFSLMGVYPGFTSELPATPGLEGAGVVAESKSSKFAAGDRVAMANFTCAEGNGTWAEKIVVSEDDLIKVPEGVTDEEACQLLVNPTTVVAMVERSGVREGDWIIQSAAGSALGRQLISYCKHIGVKTINVVRDPRPDLVAELKSLGADAVIQQGEGVAEAVRETTGGKMCAAAYECVGGEVTAMLQGALAPGGTLFIYGAMSGLTFQAGIVPQLFFDCKIHGFWVAPYIRNMSTPDRLAFIERVMTLIKDKVIVPDAGTTFPLEDFKAAVAESIKPARGKKVLLVSA